MNVVPGSVSDMPMGPGSRPQLPGPHVPMGSSFNGEHDVDDEEEKELAASPSRSEDLFLPGRQSETTRSAHSSYATAKMDVPGRDRVEQDGHKEEEKYLPVSPEPDDSAMYLKPKRSKTTRCGTAKLDVPHSKCHEDAHDDQRHMINTNVLSPRTSAAQDAKSAVAHQSLRIR